MNNSFRLVSVGLALLALPLAAQHVTAQIPALSSEALSDSSLVIVPFRPMEEIDADLERAAEILVSDRSQQIRAEAAEKASDGYVKVTESQIEAIDAQRELAEEQGDEEQKDALEEEKRALEELKRFHERERELRKAEAELAEARLEQAEAARRALTLEKELAAQRSRRHAGGLSINQIQVLAELEKETLEAQKEAFDRDGDVADREKSVIERRLDLFEARKRLFERGS